MRRCFEDLGTAQEDFGVTDLTVCRGKAADRCVAFEPCARLDLILGLKGHE